MSETLGTGESFGENTLYNQLIDLRNQAKRLGYNESVVLRGVAEIGEAESIEVFIGAMDVAQPAEPLYLRIGENLSDPWLSDWIAVHQDGRIARHQRQNGHFTLIQDPDEREILSEVIREFVLSAE